MDVVCCGICEFKKIVVIKNVGEDGVDVDGKNGGRGEEKGAYIPDIES